MDHPSFAATVLRKHNFLPTSGSRHEATTQPLSERVNDGLILQKKSRGGERSVAFRILFASSARYLFARSDIGSLFGKTDVYVVVPS